MLDGVGEPMPRQSVLDIIAERRYGQFFETGAAIDELVRLQNLEEDADGRLSLSEKEDRPPPLYLDQSPIPYGNGQ